MVVDAVLRVRRERRAAVQASGVRLVVAEHRARRHTVGSRCGLEPVPREAVPLDHDRVAVQGEDRHGLVGVPPPPVAEPQRGQHVDGRLVGAAVLDGDAREHLGRRDLRVGDLHRPEPVVREHAGVEQLVLTLLLAAAGVLVDELLVGVRGLRVVVAPPQPGVAGQAVHEPPVLLHVLAVVALGTGQPEHPLLEDRVDAVPQRQPEAQLVPDVGEPRHPVLVPAVRARAGVVVRERAPRVAVVAVVLAHRAPRALGEVRAPLVPGVGVEQVVLGPSRRLREPAVLGRVGLAVALHASSSTEAGPRGQPRSGAAGAALSTLAPCAWWRCPRHEHDAGSRTSERGQGRRRHPAVRGDQGLVRHLAADLRRSGRADRRHATPPRRREAVDRAAQVQPRSQLLHAAAGPGGTTARHLHGLAAQRHPRRADRRRPLRAARLARAPGPVSRLRGVRLDGLRDRGLRGAGTGRHRHRRPSRLPGRQAVPDPPGARRAGRGSLRRSHPPTDSVPDRDPRRRCVRLARRSPVPRPPAPAA